MAQSKNLTLAFSSESSIEEELKRESTADVITILVISLFLFMSIPACPDSYIILWKDKFFVWGMIMELCKWVIVMFYHKSQYFLIVGVYCLMLDCTLILLQVSYLVMFAYISLALGDTPQLSSFYISSKVQSQH